MAKIKSFLICICALLIIGAPDLYGSSRDGVAKVYNSQLHVRELTARNDGREVEMYLASAGLGKGHAWCGAFVNWVLKTCGHKTPTSAAWAPSWFPKARLTSNPQHGDVFGIYYANLKRIGHVGFIDAWPPDGAVITVEGNTNGAGSREGNGVFRKRRLKRSLYKAANWIDT